MNEDRDLQRILTGLRAQYLAEAPGRIADLRAVLGRVRGGDGSALGELRLLLHRLAGSGGSYGLQAVTDTARSAEHAVYELMDRAAPVSDRDTERMSTLVDAVALAFREAGAAT